MDVPSYNCYISLELLIHKCLIKQEIKKENKLGTCLKERPFSESVCFDLLDTLT